METRRMGIASVATSGQVNEDTMDVLRLWFVWFAFVLANVGHRIIFGGAVFPLATGAQTLFGHHLVEGFVLL